MNQPYQKFINFKCENSISHGNQPITHICTDKNCKSSVEFYSVQNGKKSIGKLTSQNSFLLCRECVQSTHFNHNVIPIEQFIREAKTESNSNIYDLNKQSPNYQQYEQKKNNVLSSLAKLSQKITTYASYIKAKELSETNDKTLNQRLITQNLQQQEFIMQRIFTLEGNNYSNQAEFEIMLKEVQEGLNKNKNVLKQYELSKKEEDIQLKELDLIHLKLYQETSKILTFFEKDLSFHVNQKLTEYINANNKQGQNEKYTLEEAQEKKSPIVEQSAFEQISKLFSSGGKNNQNQLEQDGQQQQGSNNQQTQQTIVKQRLLDIQNLNPAINHNSTPISSKNNNSKGNSAGFSNSKQGKFSTALTNVSGGFSDQKQNNEQFNLKSSTNSAIKGYSILSAMKSYTPQQITNENESAIPSSSKQKETPPAFASVFPQLSSSKVSPTEKRILGQNINHGSNIVFVTNDQSSAVRNKIPEIQKNQIEISGIRQHDTNVIHQSKIFTNNCNIKNIGGNLSPIKRPSNIEEDSNFDAKEIIQENNIEWLDSNEYNFIDRGQFLLQNQKKIIDEDFVVGRNIDFDQKQDQDELEIEKDDGINFDECVDDDEDDDFDLNSEDNQDQDKENENQQGYERFGQINNQFSQIGNNNLKSQQLLAQNVKPFGIQQSQENNLQEKRKQKRLRKRQQKKDKKQKQQFDVIEQSQQQVKLKQLEEDLVSRLQNANEKEKELQKQVQIEQSKTKSFQYSSCDPLNKKSWLNNHQPAKVEKNNKQKQQQQQQVVVQQLPNGKKVTNFQNLLNQMKSNAQQQQQTIHQLKQQTSQTTTQSALTSSKIVNTKTKQNNINAQNTSIHFDGDNSPDLSTFSNSEFTKKKLKTNNQSNIEDQSYSSIQNAPSVATTISNYTSKETYQMPPSTMMSSTIRNNSMQLNSLRNNLINDNTQKLINQQSQMYAFNDDQLQQLQNLSSQHSQASTSSYRREYTQPYLNNSSLKQDNINITNNYQPPQNYSNNLRNSLNNQQQQVYQPISHINQQPNNFNYQRNQSRFVGRQQELIQNQMIFSSSIQSSQESNQAPVQSYQSQIIARNNSLARPYNQQSNNEQNFVFRQTSFETATPIEEQIVPNSKVQLDWKQNQERSRLQSLNLNYSNPYNQLQTSNRIVEKNKPYQPESTSINNNHIQQFSNQVSVGLEQIQQQIEFTSSLRDQLEKKIQEEQENSTKYSQCSSTKRLKFQIQNDDSSENLNTNFNNKKYGRHNPNQQKFNINERLFQNEDSSSNQERNSYDDDLSPILYSPGVQFSPVDSEEQLDN